MNITMLEPLLMEQYKNESYLRELRSQLEKEKVVVLDELFSNTVIDFFMQEGERLKTHGKSRDLILDKFDSPRKITTIGGQAMKQYSNGLYDLYCHPELMAFLSSFTGEPIYSCTNVHEWGAYNITEGLGETLGWHVDDAPYVLAIILKENLRAEKKGGSLEYIPQWDTLCEQHGYTHVKNIEAFKKEGHKSPSDIYPMIDLAMKEEMVSELYCSAGQAYLFKTEGVMHRLKPIEVEDGYRTTIAFGYQVTPQLDFYEDGKDLYD